MWRFCKPRTNYPPNGIVDKNGNNVVWESCITMNNNWGYNAKDKNFKSSDMLIKKLVECVSKNGNLLLNIGPDAKGNIPKESKKILSEIGEWMQYNSNSIYNCSGSRISKPEYGRVTQSKNKIYYHVMEPQIGFIPLNDINKNDVDKIRLLETGTEIKIEDNWIVNNYNNIVFVSLGDNPELPNKTDTVIEVTLK